MENKCINCSVSSCKFHEEGKNFCTLSEIRIASDGAENNSPSCTCCNSFVLKKDKDCCN